MFEKVLVANRGEIAIRVMRTLRRWASARSPSTRRPTATRPTSREADEAHLLGPPVPAESYLNVERLLETASEAGAEAIHPGYGFLAENAEFAAACEEAGITFIGPPASAIEAMGSKTRARELMAAAGVPIVPGHDGPGRERRGRREGGRRRSAIRSPARPPAEAEARDFGWRDSEDELEEAFEGAAREGEKFFSDPTRLPRALPRGSPPRRGPGAGRLARQRRSTSASATARSSAATRS